MYHNYSKIRECSYLYEKDIFSRAFFLPISNSIICLPFVYIAKLLICVILSIKLANDSLKLIKVYFVSSRIRAGKEMIRIFPVKK